jgi:hypothetical protein
MKWYVLVRHERQDLNKEVCNNCFGVEGGCGKIHEKQIYPKEGYPILTFADKTRAMEVLKGNPIGKNPGEYEVVEVMVAGT